MTTQNGIRLATPADAEAILAIYAPYVLHTAISFETEVPTIDAFSRRIESICGQYPFIVYQRGSEVTGYAYASRHRERAAYRYDVDVSIYLAPDRHGSGDARRLYACLFDMLRELGYCNAYAAYALPNPKSERFHRKFGFEPIGVHKMTGYKLGAWHDVAWVAKAIQPHPVPPPPVKAMRDLSPSHWQPLFLEHSN